MLTVSNNKKGLKVRRIRTASSSNITHDLWPVPIHLEEIASLKIHNLTEPKSDRPQEEIVRILPSQIHGPDVNGYSFSWSGEFIFLHTHHKGEDVPVNMYRECGQMFDFPV